MDFIRGRGYVLDFSDSSFAAFFASELDVDIDDPAYAEQGGSKGKRLRCFLQKVDTASAERTLRALGDHRTEWLARTGKSDPVPDAEERFLALVARLNGAPETNRDQPPQPATDLAPAHRPPRRPCPDREPAAAGSGYAFEDFMQRCFDVAGLKAREPFRNVGEQIDGSFLLGEEIYLLEAKWQVSPTGVGDLHAFHGKLEQKAAWARGLFVSYNGFTEGLTAFCAGKRLICMDGRDLHDALDRQIPLRAVLERKVRRAAETGHAQVPVGELFGLQTTGAER